ncbi:MAG TPA: YegS/Rv2252/BmrU family lipid kinase [Mycobacteriales bacterium]|jgi:YegS/Rv2252/BmrU family lipid kinase|nr:YegS/Rv2252/BmrU family lipid kinase [Mycobacteriales bacterium]
MPRRVALLVNPSAGRGRSGRLLPAVLARLGADGHDVLVRPTASLEHGDELVASALQDDRVVVALGGDGLVGRVAGGVAAGGGLLAALPGGRGSDFARAAGLGRDPVAACAVLTDGVETRIDLGDVDGRAFLCIASVGFDSVVQEIALATRLPLGAAVYPYAALRAALTWRAAGFSGSVDGATFTMSGWAVAAANSGVYGGGMRLAPDASVVDGLLDVVTTSATPRLRFVRGLARVYRGTHVALPNVRVQRARTVHLAADRPFVVFADGDPIGTLPCTISVRPAALRVLLPA